MQKDDSIPSDGTKADSEQKDEDLFVRQHRSKPNVICRLFYFDQNSRVYEMDGVKKGSPYHRGYFRLINIVGENEKEFICEYGVVNKKSGMYNWGRGKFKTYTEQEMLDDVYVAENRHLLAEKVRTLKADVLRQIENILLANGV